ncbi:MAG: hypothetical protein IPK26_00345 [Planctomycetes bacterium]|nr:hypothetical protein [Planctomycetota bacterium]
MRALPFLLLAVPLLAQTPTVAELVDSLAAARTLDGPAIGDDGSRSDTWKTYERLRGAATEVELHALLEHSSPIVRCYALRALLENETKADWPAVLRAHSRDTAEVMQFEGCGKMRLAVGDVMVDFVRDHKAMTDAQWLELAAVLIRDKSPLYAREWSLRNLTFGDDMLHEIRTLAKAGEPSAAIALARYRIDKDVPILIEHLRRPEPFDQNCSFLAAEISGSQELLPALRAIVPAATHRLANDNAYRLRFWLQALAAQKSEAAVATLLTFLREAPTTDYKRTDLQKTYRELIDALPADPVFAPLRTAAGKDRPNRR